MRFLTFLIALPLFAETHPHVVRAVLVFDSAEITIETQEFGEDEESMGLTRRSWTIKVPQERMEHQGAARRFDNPQEAPKVHAQVTKLRGAVEEWVGATVQAVQADYDEKTDDWTFTFTLWRDGKWIADTRERETVPQGLLGGFGGWLRYCSESVLWWLDGGGVLLPGSKVVAHAPRSPLAL